MSRKPLRLTKCENDQLVEATKLWFARNGGVVDQKIKAIDLKQDDEESDFIMPPNWNKHKPSEDL